MCRDLKACVTARKVLLKGTVQKASVTPQSIHRALSNAPPAKASHLLLTGLAG